MDVVWRILCWSFTALREGRWPREDPWGRKYMDLAPGGPDDRRAGTLLASGHRAVIWVVKGDLDYFASSLGLAHHAASKPCAKCPANSVPGDPLSWTEFRPTVAAWPHELISDDEFDAMHEDRHPLFKMPGVRLSTVYIDMMHTKFMGTDAYTYGSALWLLVYNVLPG